MNSTSKNPKSCKMAQDMQNIFKLKCLIENISIKLCARIESGVKQLLALLTSDGEVILYYAFGELPAIIKRIPWYSDSNKSIQAICFDPTATWLLVVSLDGSLYIIPALSLVDKKQKVDCKWSLNDVTQFLKSTQTPHSKPTALVWWQTLDCNQNGLVGYEDGTIALISLTDGRCLATCTIHESVTQLFLCQDNSLEAVSLLINGESGQQWKHILEQHSVGYVWPPELNNHTDDSTRSRLLSLKQMGVDKLVFLKQRLVEGRVGRRDSFTSDSTSESSHSESLHSGPELLPHLCDTYFAPQYARDRYLFSAFYKPTSLLTVHAVDLEAAPLYTHKLMRDTHSLLLTDKLIFTSNSERNILSVISTHLSECRLEGDADFNSDALIVQFHMKQEKILEIYKLADLSAVRLRKYKDDRKDKLFEMPKCVDDLHVRKPRLDTCVLVTNAAVYSIVINVPPIEKFVHNVIEESNFVEAEKLSIIFSLNLQQLLEGCGDLLIARGSFHSGIILYKQAKIHLLKRVLKLAVSADCKTLLKFVHLCLSSSKVDMSMATKIHIGNLAVMAYTELILRYGGHGRISNTKDFMNFLRYEEFYDQILAVNVACQAAHWNIVTLLAKARGLQPEVVSALGQILQSARAPRPSDKEFLIALSEPSLTQSLLLAPKSSHIIFNYIRSNVEILPRDILQRLVVQLDPSQPCVIPVVRKIFQSNKFCSSLDSTTDSYDVDNSDTNITIVKEVVDTFITVLIYFIWRADDLSYNLTHLEKIKCPEEKVENHNIKKVPDVQPLCCGYEHAAVVRNSSVYTMGVSNSGCLGLGPLLTQSSPPKVVDTLTDLNVKAISVSCGRKHTLALTDFGIYAWGSNNYGQLGLGLFVHETPYPQIIGALAALKIVQVVAGQYHSLALTSTGQVYTWGWGIHGQLGHGTCDNEYYPRLLEFDKSIMQITAGHAHSIILTCEGQLFGFGSNVFGQLESCQNEASKYPVPVQIHVLPDITTPIAKISSAYFHNIAIRADQQVYTWGASPQEVRLHQSKNNQKQNGISCKPMDSWKATVHVYTAVNKRPIEQVAVGYRHSAILHNGKILWGKNKDNELSPPKLREQDTLSMFHHRFLHVSCGLDYTMAIDNTGKLLAWGSLSMAQTILGRCMEDDRKAEGKVVIFKNTRRVVKFQNNLQGNSENFPVEVPGLPTMAITFNPTDHHLLFSRKTSAFAISSIENDMNSPGIAYTKSLPRSSSPLQHIQHCPELKYGQKTLHYVLETYFGLYDSESVQSKCLNVQNYQAASKIAMLDGRFSDSLSFQLTAFKTYMNTLDADLKALTEENNLYNLHAKDNGYMQLVRNINNINDRRMTHSNSFDQLSCGNSPAHILSTSSSLDSIRHWDDLEHQGGCESPCEVGEISDIRQNMSQYVQSLKNNQNSPPISSVSELFCQVNKVEFDTRYELEIKDKNVKHIIETISSVVEFYIEKIYVSENHILMQNILMKCIEFWLTNRLPVPILERILLKNMDKYFYPLSILLFCKNFTNSIDDEFSQKDCSINKNSAGFLKEFSTKFCLQLCSMVLENVNKN